MLFNELKVNAELMYYGKKYTVLSVEPPVVHICRSHGDGETLSINFTELVTNPSFRPGKLMLKEIEEQDKKYKSILDALNTKKRQQVSFRFEMIKPILVLANAKQGDVRAVYEFTEFYSEYLSEGQTVDDLTQECLIKKIEKSYDVDGYTPRGVSLRSMKRYLEKFRHAQAQWESAGEDALISRAGEGHKYRNDNKELQICHPKQKDVVLDTLTVRFDEKYLPIYKEVIEKEYLNLRKISKQAAYNSICIKCTMAGYEIPKWITVMKQLEKIDERALVRFRHGTSAFSDRYDPVERGYSNKEMLYPLHVVQIDHTPLDMDIRDDYGNVMQRAWITMGICVFSRVVWCLYILLDTISRGLIL